MTSELFNTNTFYSDFQRHLFQQFILSPSVRIDNCEKGLWKYVLYDWVQSVTMYHSLSDSSWNLRSWQRVVPLSATRACCVVCLWGFSIAINHVGACDLFGLYLFQYEFIVTPYLCVNFGPDNGLVPAEFNIYQSWMSPGNWNLLRGNAGVNDQENGCWKWCIITSYSSGINELNVVDVYRLAFIRTFDASSMPSVQSILEFIVLNTLYAAYNSAISTVNQEFNEYISNKFHVSLENIFICQICINYYYRMVVMGK